MEYDELKRLMDGQKDEMTAAERMKAYNAGEEVDYIPYTLQAPSEEPWGQNCGRRNMGSIMWRSISLRTMRTLRGWK